MAKAKIVDAALLRQTSKAETLAQLCWYCVDQCKVMVSRDVVLIHDEGVRVCPRAALLLICYFRACPFLKARGRLQGPFVSL